jgi:hypothetical protein
MGSADLTPDTIYPLYHGEKRLNGFIYFYYISVLQTGMGSHKLTSNLSGYAL